ncbi:hypothetical protein DRQ07_10120 [candidate division KSB1 bacterium]|nr:MAG: hypothetical protein DRQ07_10120 [candidate division KSB1 bacterium]
MQIKVTEFLKGELSHIYCDTCKFNEEREGYDECHRKYINWKASKQFCKYLAKNIVENLLQQSTNQGQKVKSNFRPMVGRCVA